MLEIFRLHAANNALTVIQRQPRIPVCAVRPLIQLQLFVHMFCMNAVAHRQPFSSSVCSTYTTWKAVKIRAITVRGLYTSCVQNAGGYILWLLAVILKKHTRCMEASTGIEPVYTDLQSAA